MTFQCSRSSFRSRIAAKHVRLGLACFLISRFLQTPWQISAMSITQRFVIAKDVTSSVVVCGIASSTVSQFPVRSRVECAQLCRGVAVARNRTTCIGFNFFSDVNACELYTALPNFNTRTGCAFYGPDICYTVVYDSNPRISSEVCSFPYTYGGRLYYECVPISALGITRDTVCDVFGCLMKHFKKAVCYSTDYKATNVTAQITIPTQSGTIPVLTVNNWIMIQQNVLSGSSFNVGWTAYQTGFGSLASNYWMGNENIHLLSTSDNYMLRIEMLSVSMVWISAEYDMFYVGSATIYYELYLGFFPPPATGVYYGDGGDSMQYPFPAAPTFTPYLVYHGFMPFSTSDKQTGPAACAASYQGGWWYNNCLYALLNTASSTNFVWNTASGASTRLTVSRMMIKLI